MTMAEQYLNELEAMDKRHSMAPWLRNTNISESTRNAYLEQQTAEKEKLRQKYGLKEIVLETKGILKNVRYEFPDGSIHIVKMFD